MARPEIVIDAKQVLKLAALGAKTEEIADFFDCSTDTIQRRFAAELTKGRANLKMSLRQWQLKAAEKGNATMLIWLGKHLLGQKDDAPAFGAISSDSVKLSKEEILELARAIRGDKAA